MSDLISLENVTLAFGLHPLLDQVKLQMKEGERVCLIGRNGAGKSSLLKIIEGTLLPDSGSVWRKPNIRIAKLAQELPESSTLTVYEFVASGLAAIGELLQRYQHVIHELNEAQSDKALKELAHIQHELDVQNGWLFDQQIQTILTRLQLDGEKLLSQLSGGWQRRVALAKSLVSQPDLLLLDEPTNHLDIETIEWLEGELIASNVALLFITHDRALLQRLATRIIELDRGKLTSWPGDYENFLQHKEELLHAEEKANADFDKKLAQEEKWIRQGIKARRTRNEGRVRALKTMRDTRLKRREKEKTAEFSVNEATQSGQLVFELQDVSYPENHSIINHFSLRVMRGDRIGLIGPNGIGKTTLLNILLGNLKPTEGLANQGTQLQIAYFDQLRKTLDLNKTVIDNVIEGSETIEINGKKQHIISYLGDFLFAPQRALTPVKALSGGECNRLLLAKLFAQPANVLVLDEPTNDLDIETLELLEDLLTEFKGTILIVSHDRKFLDNIVTSVLAFEGNGKILEYVGGYEDWFKQRSVQTNENNKIEKSANRNQDEKIKPEKLTYKEQKELESLPKTIESLEEKLQALQEKMANADFYKQDSNKITDTLNALQTLQTEINSAYSRWDFLEAKQKSLQK